MFNKFRKFFQITLLNILKRVGSYAISMYFIFHTFMKIIKNKNIKKGFFFQIYDLKDHTLNLRGATVREVPLHKS